MQEQKEKQSARGNTQQLDGISTHQDSSPITDDLRFQSIRVYVHARKFAYRPPFIRGFIIYHHPRHFLTWMATYSNGSWSWLTHFSPWNFAQLKSAFFAFPSLSSYSFSFLLLILAQIGPPPFFSHFGFETSPTR